MNYLSKKITVIICTFKGGEQLDVALKSLVNQDLDSSLFDVIVVDNGCSDKTRKNVLKFRKLLNINYLQEKKIGLSYARNKGITGSKTDYIAFIDDDAKAKKNWIKRAYQIIEEVNPDIFGGPIYSFFNCKRPSWFKKNYGSFFICNEDRFLGQNEFLCGSNFFLKKRILREIGLFDTSLGIRGDKLFLGEDVKLQFAAFQNNIGIYHDHNLIVYHLVSGPKMKIRNIVRRHFLSMFFTGRIFKDKQLNVLIFNFLYYIFASLGWLLTFPFKRREYPRLINLLIEKIFPKLEVAGINFFAIFFKLRRY